MGPIEAWTMWFGRPPARRHYRETTTAVMEAMDAAELYRQDEDPQRSKHMSPDDVARLLDLADLAGPVIAAAKVEDEVWARFSAGLELVE